MERRPVLSYLGWGLLVQALFLTAWIVLKEPRPESHVLVAMIVGHSLGGGLSGVLMWITRTLRANGLVWDYVMWAVVTVCAFYPGLTLSTLARGHEVDHLAGVVVLLGGGLSWRAWMRYLEAHPQS
jgi:hypothetical protein